MDNPFLSHGAVAPFASLNRVTVRGRTVGNLLIGQSPDAQTLGRIVADALVILKTGDASDRALRDDWGDEHWAWWAGVERVFLSGGRMTGDFGQAVYASAIAAFDSLGARPVELVVPENAAFLPLVGAAKLALRHASHALAFDFGHTGIKRGVTIGAADGGAGLIGMERLPAAHVGFSPADETPEEAMLLHDHIVNAILRTHIEAQAMGFARHAALGISIANYTGCDGPGSFAARGGYGKLKLVGEPYANALAATLAPVMGECVPLFIHDGTSAAFAVGPQDVRSAALTLGTSAGIGFCAEV